MTTTTSEPTPEMVAFYERRTEEHIERVRRCLTVMASVTEYGDDLRERARIHDASKFGPEERVPYIWLTEFHRCRRSGAPFEYPAGMEGRVRAAIDHHMTANRHHPEFHTEPNDMTDIDLIEMVCESTSLEQSEVRQATPGAIARHASRRCRACSRFAFKRVGRGA